MMCPRCNGDIRPWGVCQCDEKILKARIAELEKVAEAAVAVVPYLDTWLSPDDEEYMNLETLEVCLRTAGYLEEETL